MKEEVFEGLFFLILQHWAFRKVYRMEQGRRQYGNGSSRFEGVDFT